MNKKLRIITLVLLVCFAVSGYQVFNHTIYAHMATPLLGISTLGLQVILIVILIGVFTTRRQR